MTETKKKQPARRGGWGAVAVRLQVLALPVVARGEHWLDYGPNTVHI
jgi:hypothetical protein